MYISNRSMSDLLQVDKAQVIEKVEENSKFTPTFIILLTSSIIICTLGLLMNSTAIVIGGMIISPLMWPLMQTAIGISYGRTHFIKKSLIILILSTLLSIFAAFLITYLTPIRFVTPEILARTTPTLLDIAVALVAGVVAALAITHPKVSESLAGVAIATSLMPPICVAGIGLALFKLPVFFGGLLLFTANVVSIIFVSVLMFLLIGLKNQSEPTFQKRALGLTAVLLLLTCIPLFIFLREYAFNSVVYNRVEEVLVTNFAEFDEDLVLSSFRTTSDKDIVVVEATVLIPEGVSINFEQRQNLQDSLETALNRPVSLDLFVQRTISVVGQSDILISNKRREIENTFVAFISALDGNFTVDKLDVRFRESRWTIDSILVADPTDVFSVTDRDDLISSISTVADSSVDLNLELVSRLKMQTSLDSLNDRVLNTIETYLSSFEGFASVSQLKLLDTADDSYEVQLQITVTSNTIIPTTLSSDITDLLVENFEKDFNVEVYVLRVEEF